MKIDGEEIIFKGHGFCSECGMKFEDEPMTCFNQMKQHQADTGHNVWGEDVA